MKIIIYNNGNWGTISERFYDRLRRMPIDELEHRRIKGIAQIGELAMTDLMKRFWKNDRGLTIEETRQCQDFVHSRTGHQSNVDRFHILSGLTWRAEPEEGISFEERRLRAALILEEAFETIEEGLGIEIQVEIVEPKGEQTYVIGFDALSFRDSRKINWEKLIDGCCDLKVVTTGTLSQFGIHDKPFQNLVDENNLQKVFTGTINDVGKLIKHPDHKPPQIQELFSKMYIKRDQCPRCLSKNSSVHREGMTGQLGRIICDDCGTDIREWEAY